MSDTVLIVEDNADTLAGLSELLEIKGFEVHQASTLAEARTAYQEHALDAILLDLVLPDGNGLEWVGDLRAYDELIAVVIVTGEGDLDTAVTSIKIGADHYLPKPVQPDSLETILARAIRARRDRIRLSSAQHGRLASEKTIFHGQSAPVRSFWEMAQIATGNEAPVLITGETGTGKGIVARWIHDHSARQEEEFTELNCSALGGDLLLSELFGHRRGAFTSAHEDRHGLLEVANNGTLFLDEVGDMDLDVQAKLLKVIEERTFRRIGETKKRHSNFRLICATNRDLIADVKEGSFREDLFFRINVFPISVPPIREYHEDVPRLIQHQARLIAPHRDPLSEEVVELLSAYSWPGNIREIRNMLERAFLLAPGRVPTIRDFPGLRPEADSLGTQSETAAGDWSLEQAEAAHLRRALEHFEHAVPEAAKALGVSRATLYRKLKKYGILTPQA